MPTALYLGRAMYDDMQRTLPEHDLALLAHEVEKGRIVVIEPIKISNPRTRRWRDRIRWRDTIA